MTGGKPKFRYKKKIDQNSAKKRENLVLFVEIFGFTETVKDLGKSMGNMVVVFNCSEEMGVAALGNTPIE